MMNRLSSGMGSPWYGYAGFGVAVELVGQALHQWLLAGHRATGDQIMDGVSGVAELLQHLDGVLTEPRCRAAPRHRPAVLEPGKADQRHAVRLQERLSLTDDLG